MATWIKQGVYGHLTTEAAQAKRQVEKLFQDHNEDLYITSIQESTHNPGSYHPQGDAFDIRIPVKIAIHEIRQYIQSIPVYGLYYDVVEELDHYHVEFDRTRFCKRTT